MVLCILGVESADSDNSESDKYDSDKDPNYNPSSVFIVDRRFIHINCINYFIVFNNSIM